MASPSERAEQAAAVRAAAADLAGQVYEESVSNGEEDSLPNAIANFTKGLRKTDNGDIVDFNHYVAFIDACNSGNIDDIAALTLGPDRGEYGGPVWRSRLANTANDGSPVGVRGWESMSAGLAYNLIGPDPQAVAMPPVPFLTSNEVIAEMAEVYCMALARDIPFNEWHESEQLQEYICMLNDLPWFADPEQEVCTEAEARRRRGCFTPQSVFRGILPGSKKGPYLSQFLIVGSNQLDSEVHEHRDGIISYGPLTIDQRVRIVEEGVDYLTSMDTFLDCQEGANFRGLDKFKQGKRFIRNLRDLCTYVHYDALYQAYLNACLIMLANKVPYSDELPFVNPNDWEDKQSGFALFGSPHILTLVTEVATRALKAVRYQKFNIHRRARPEAVGGLIHMQKNDGCFESVQPMVDCLEPILEKIGEYNAKLNEYHASNLDGGSGSDENECDSERVSYLCPMAYPEGSPMHPSYGSGHATVAGACVTVLKAFFKEDYELTEVYDVKDDDELERIELPDGEVLTVGSELEKLCDNISIGRDAAGVHWFSDQWESMLMGERIAIQILRETQLTLNEKFNFRFTSFTGNTITIYDGQLI